MILPTSKKYLWGEMLLFFILIPLLLVLPNIPLWLKIFPVVSGFSYVLFAVYSYSKFKIQLPRLQTRWFWKIFLIRLIPIIIFGYLIVMYLMPQDLFRLIIEDTRLWIIILFVYSIGSVLPQELIYRNFFFNRYEKLFHQEWLFIVINALLFAISHLFLKSWIVLVMTFLGGIMFALTYRKTKSTILVTLEHSVYGLWLFSAGIGSLLAFPS